MVIVNASMYTQTHGFGHDGHINLLNDDTYASGQSDLRAQKRKRDIVH
jgi:hypothetical protein